MPLVHTVKNLPHPTVPWFHTCAEMAHFRRQLGRGSLVGLVPEMRLPLFVLSAYAALAGSVWLCLVIKDAL